MGQLERWAKRKNRERQEKEKSWNRFKRIYDLQPRGQRNATQEKLVAILNRSHRRCSPSCPACQRNRQISTLRMKEREKNEEREKDG